MIFVRGSKRDLRFSLESFLAYVLKHELIGEDFFVKTACINNHDPHTTSVTIHGDVIGMDGFGRHLSIGRGRETWQMGYLSMLL